MGQIQKGLMAAGVGALLGAGASFGGGKLGENVSVLRERWYALPLVMVAAGGLAYSKGYQKLGIALGATGGIFAYSAYASQQMATPTAGYQEAGRASAWPSDSGAFERPAPNAGALFNNRRGQAGAMLGEGAMATMRQGAGALMGANLGTDAMGLGR
jgi:ABC-type dipeptide/oligopeptide/nickel transport system permease subunit